MSLCARARDHVSVDFVDRFGAVAKLYDFELMDDASEKYAAVAIHCSTSPELYLCLGSAERRIKIIMVKGVIDRYEFELDHAKATSVVACECPYLNLHLGVKWRGDPSLNTMYVIRRR